MEQEIAVRQLTVGTILSDHYEIQRLIAHGGMGAVYEAVNLQGDFQVAAKVLHKQFQSERDYRKRFEREIKLLRTISHPNVVKIFDFGEHENQLYYIMELVEGTRLDQIVESGKLQTSKLTRIILELCDGLAAIHNKGIVHRDIRPSNIMLMNDSSPKIIDFSIAWRADLRLTRNNLRVGTFEYIAPEIWAGKQPTHLADQYGLGITLYEALIGRSPFDKTDMESMITFHQHSSLPTLRSFGVKYPIWFEHMIEKMVARNPEDRFESAHEIIKYIRKHDETMNAVQSFSGSMASGTYRNGENMITVFQSLSDATDTIVRKQHEVNAILLASKKDRMRSGKLLTQPFGRSKTVVIKIPGRSARPFEVKMPSLDYLFLGGFLISLNIFDAYLTHEGVSQLGVAAERNIFLKGLMETYGSRNVLIGAKVFAIIFAIYLTYLAHKSKHIQLIVGLLSCVYLTCAIIPWIYLLYWM